MTVRLLGHGAESKVYYVEKDEKGINIDENKNILEDIYEKIDERKFVVKIRLRKTYLNEKIDEKIRKYRMKIESKIIRRLYNIINVPKILYEDYDNFALVLEYIDGIKFQDFINEKNKIYLKFLGEIIGKIHRYGVVHGDLTTQNILIKNNEIYLIDFGLSFLSRRIEDFATDIELLKKLLDNIHWDIENAFNLFIDGYINTFDMGDQVIKRVNIIEMRGRYKSVMP